MNKPRVSDEELTKDVATNKKYGIRNAHPPPLSPYYANDLQDCREELKALADTVINTRENGGECWYELAYEARKKYGWTDD